MVRTQGWRIIGCPASITGTPKFCWLVLFATMGAAWGEESLAADRVFSRLMAGNRRYRQHKEQYSDETLARRREPEIGQDPFAVILSCSDSRVPPELIFDEGLGDLFVVRVAANIATDGVLGSIGYAVEHLHTKLILALGHENCGVVSAAVEGGDPSGHLGSLVSAILPRGGGDAGCSGGSGPQLHDGEYAQRRPSDPVESLSWTSLNHKAQLNHRSLG